MCEENPQLINEDTMTEDDNKVNKKSPPPPLLGEEFSPIYILDNEVGWWDPPHIDYE